MVAIFSLIILDNTNKNSYEIFQNPGKIVVNHGGS